VTFRDQPAHNRTPSDVEFSPAAIGYDGRPPLLEPLAGLTARERQSKACPKRNVNHCVVCWLLSQRLISKREHEAAERLQADFSGKEITPLKGVNLMGTGGCHHGPSTVPQVRVDARKAYDGAMSFAGENGAALLKAVVVEDLSLTATAKLLRCHEKGILPALRVALGVLIFVYAQGLEFCDATRTHQGPTGHRGAGAHRSRLPSRS
jgi:hypothetical protein